jgi:hypothetical protein
MKASIPSVLLALGTLFQLGNAACAPLDLVATGAGVSADAKVLWDIRATGLGLASPIFLDNIDGGSYSWVQFLK